MHAIPAPVPVPVRHPADEAPTTDGPSGARDRDLVEELLRSACAATGSARQKVLDEVVLIHLDLAGAIARQYAGRGLDVDDLVQVARLALCKAARGYRPERGGSFTAYAVPTIAGELKRHFRDTGWAVRPPRRLQELRARIGPTVEELRRTAHADPSERELALALGVELRELREARACDGGYDTVPIDGPGLSGRGARAGHWDGGYARLEDGMSLQQALVALTPREHQLLRLRFVEERTQSDIGRVLGVSQMQVSRLLAGVLARLRVTIEDEPCSA